MSADADDGSYGREVAARICYVHARGSQARADSVAIWRARAHDPEWGLTEEDLAAIEMADVREEDYL